MSVPLVGVSIFKVSEPQIMPRYLVGQKTLIFRKETPSSFGLTITYDPHDSMKGSEGPTGGPAVVRFGRGPVPGAVVGVERGSEPEAVVWGVSRAVVTDERRPSTGEVESMAMSSSLAEFESESQSESVDSSLRRFFPAMGKWQENTMGKSGENENQCRRCKNEASARKR